MDLDLWARHLADSHVALVTYAFSNRSARLPVKDITRIARDAGAVSIVDAVQTTGVIPYQANDLGADFILGTCVKYLCGGQGAGYLWADPEVAARCEPVDTGWFSHENPFEFDIHSYRLAEGAMRFWGGTPSIAPFVVAKCGIDEIAAAGVQNNYLHNQGLIDRIHAGLPEGAAASEVERDHRGNAVMIRVMDIDAALSDLKRAGVSADNREGNVRVSPHIYNTEAEIDLLLEVVAPHVMQRLRPLAANG
ncbi:MAG: aminotransferase class V-fold PLP-dependent enzyme, partial [Pseudomonadota bacterium]